MPIYEYAAIAKGCPHCEAHFDVLQKLADAPLTQCPRCGAVAGRSDGVVAEAKAVKPPRTHWDMLRERRSIEELEELLAERLGEIRGN